MRIISGKYRGKKLLSPKDERVRPTTDMVKENVFNLLPRDFEGLAFLDLFAGSGAIGIEAISRGAKRVIFVDRDRESMEYVRRNLELIGERAETMTSDYHSAINKLKGSKFDIIYIDAPYNMMIIDEVLTAIKSNALLNDNGLVVYESLAKTNQKSMLNDYELVKSRKYGSVIIDIYCPIINDGINLKNEETNGDKIVNTDMERV